MRTKTRPLMVVGGLFLALILSGSVAFGQEAPLVRLTGKLTLPVAPTQLKVGDAFMVTKGGEGMLTYADGSYFKLKPGVKGRITPRGLYIDSGEVRADIVKRGSQFRVETSTVIIGVLGTMFDVVALPDQCQVLLHRGRLQIEPLVLSIDPVPPVILEAGQKYTFKADEGQVEPFEPEAAPTEEPDLPAALPTPPAPVVPETPDEVIPPPLDAPDPSDEDRSPQVPFNEQNLQGVETVD
jgi:hypothetical protein